MLCACKYHTDTKVNDLDTAWLRFAEGERYIIDGLASSYTYSIINDRSNVVNRICTNALLHFPLFRNRCSLGSNLDGS